MGVGHVPQEPLRPEGARADVQGRQRGGTPGGGDLADLARARFGEREAARWYERHGYTVLDRNWRAPFGEIDLVLVRERVVVVCEVKSRASERFGGPEAAVGPDKQRRLRRLAAAWLATASADGRLEGATEVRFDVAAVVGAHVRVVEAAF